MGETNEHNDNFTPELEANSIAEEPREISEGDYINEIITDVVRTSIEVFAEAHPATYKVLERRLGRADNVVSGLIIDTLKDDAGFRALLAQTEKETDRIQLVKSLVPIALSLFEALLTGI